jgi:hypothetical protein
MSSESQSGKQLAARSAMTEPHSVEFPGRVWMAVHRAIYLGLRLPAYIGPSRALVENFLTTLGQCLVEWGVLTDDELARAERYERPVSPRPMSEVKTCGVCRVCGCTDLAPCIIARGSTVDLDGNPAAMAACSWLDPAHTLCSNLDCVAVIPMSELCAIGFPARSTPLSSRSA